MNPAPRTCVSFGPCFSPSTMAATPQKTVSGLKRAANGQAKIASAGRAKPARPTPAKSRIVPGLYQGRLLIAPDFFEPHETPPGLKRQPA